LSKLVSIVYSITLELIMSFSINKSKFLKVILVALD